MLNAVSISTASLNGAVEMLTAFSMTRFYSSINVKIKGYQLSSASACWRNTWRSSGSVISPSLDKTWLM